MTSACGVIPIIVFLFFLLFYNAITRKKNLQIICGRRRKYDRSLGALEQRHRPTGKMAFGAKHPLLKYMLQSSLVIFKC